MADRHDPEARRDTPLARELAERIRREGPLPLDQFMQACLQHPQHGYYVRQPAIGAGGDFITAPEISQVFGELIGLWCVVVWQQMGAPARVRLIELGPGRGTLMADAMRAARVVPAFPSAVMVEMLETSEALASAQRERLRHIGVPIAWPHRLTASAANLPCIVIANELIDALPIRQYVAVDGVWQERTVGLDAAGRLAFGLGPTTGARGLPLPAAAPRGTIVETRATLPLVQPMAEIARAAPFAALLVDYGHVRSTPGDTLQAVRAHRFEHPLTSPGEADLTAQVDFQALGEQARTLGFAVDGPITQGELLAALGIVERASRLMAANPSEAAQLEAGVARLMSPTGMGTRFKAIGLRSAGLPALPGFAPATR